MVSLWQSDAAMVDVAVFEQAPELQAGQQEGVVWGVGLAKSAVEAVDGPQLGIVPHDHKLHLLQSIRSQQHGQKDIGNDTVTFNGKVGPDLLALHVPLCLGDFLQERLYVQSHVWYQCK